MKTIFKKFIKYLGVTTIGILLITSCKEYLSIAPEITTTDQDVFGTFKKFQGFMEDLYQCTVDITLPTATTAEMNWNYGLDEGVMTDTRMLNYQFELGNYWAWQSSNFGPFNGAAGQPTTGSVQGYWRTGLWGIRKCNEAIKNIDILKNGTGTEEEVNLILGQAYFFRAYLHFEILRHWGHIAYIDSVYNPTDVIEPEPISYAACAARIDADLRKAVELLPANWDDTQVAQTYGISGVNSIRATKGAAWAYIGMNALYAGSPLMATDATSPNNPDSTVFDLAQMRIAAEAYGEVLNLSDPSISGGNGQGKYNLEDWRDYQRNFRSNNATPQNGKEVVWTYSWRQYKRWRYGEWAFASVVGWGTYLAPTANYVEKFGMKNGLPISDPASGYDPNNPFANRDPRYNYNILSDHDKFIITLTGNYGKPVSGTSSLSYEFADLFVGGWARSPNGSLTGYGHKKFNQIGWNNSDNLWGNNTYYDCPLIRLAGVLLEYAEAVNEAYGPNGKAPNCSLTAVDAVNKVRNRVRVGPYNPTSTYMKNDKYPYDYQEGGTPLPNVDPKYTADKATFREIIRTERCVELAFEGKRWNDARRWGVASSLKYREKYELRFDAAHTSFQRLLYSTSVFEPKHWWLPFPTQQVALYPAFKQNPGW